MAHVTTAPGLGRRTWSALAVTVLFAILAAFADANDFVRVKRVIDGDTIMLESGERVRLIGVDTPESVHAKKPVERFGKEASAFTVGADTDHRVLATARAMTKKMRLAGQIRERRDNLSLWPVYSYFAKYMINVMNHYCPNVT